MPNFSNKSKRVLFECHEDIQTIFATVIQGWDCKPFIGHRTKDKQNEAYRIGASKLKWPKSKHNKKPSRAIDISPYPIPKNWGDKDRNEYEKFRYFAFYCIGVADVLYLAGDITHKLRWGGDWDMDRDILDQKFNDLVHFELVEK